jgi:Tol biopolymer transport system component
VASTVESVPASEQLARSPDGRRLALLRAEPAADGVSNIWIADTGTGDVRRLTNHTLGRPAAASWFPDGTRIAYGVRDTLVIADVRGDESRRVKSPVPGRPVQVASVSADGSRIVLYVSGDGAWTYDLHSGRFTRVNDSGSEE